MLGSGVIALVLVHRCSRARLRSFPAFVSLYGLGAVGTPIWERSDGVSYNAVMARWVKSMIATVGISVQQGATTPLFLATSPDAVKPDVRGKYWERCGWKWTPAWMEDADLRKALWKKWEEQTKITCTI